MGLGTVLAGVPRSGGARMSGRWLAIDTATEIASVAVGSPTGAAAGAFVQGARRHAAAIVQLVDHVLTQAGLRPADLEGIVIGDGPGSFTGLRIGWAAAKGLAQQAAVPLRAVPSLMAAAAGVAARLDSVPVAACYDACADRCTVRCTCSVPVRSKPRCRRRSPPSRSWRASPLPRSARGSLSATGRCAIQTTSSSGAVPRQYRWRA